LTLRPEDALAGIPSGLRSELINEFNKITSNYVEQRWEPSQLGGGKFCEVVYSVLKGLQDGKYPAKASKPKNFPDACKKLEGNTSVPHSARILIPRVLVGLFDIRNNRSVGHVGGDVDPNHLDATFVLNAARWVLGELIRLFHNISTTDAQAVVEALTVKIVPVVWTTPGGRQRVLLPELSMRQRMFLLLYAAHPSAVSEPDLVSSLEHSNASVFRRDVVRPAHKAALIDYDPTTKMVHLSPTGVRLVEKTLPLSI